VWGRGSAKVHGPKSSEYRLLFDELRKLRSGKFENLHIFNIHEAEWLGGT
jgi:hypothetical protein